MKRLSFVAFLFALLLSFVPARAHGAEFAFSVGRDLGAVGIVGASGVTDVGTRIGLRLDRFHLFGTVDYARYSSRTTFETPDFDDVSASGSVLTAGLGTRYLFGSPKARKVRPYLVGGFFTVLPSSRTSGPPVGGIQNGWSFGFLTGFGADYYFSKSFSVGGEFGLQGLFAGFSDATSRWRGSFLSIYSSVQVTFLL